MDQQPMDSVRGGRKRGIPIGKSPKILVIDTIHFILVFNSQFLELTFAKVLFPILSSRRTFDIASCPRGSNSGFLHK